jgi:CRP-like cAMP-binding protein
MQGETFCRFLLDPVGASVPTTLRFQNKLLALVPQSELDVLLASLEAVNLPKDLVFAEMGETIRHVYFMEQGLCSILARSPEGNSVEAGMVGYEGFAPTPPVVRSGVSYHHVNMQANGHGYRMTVEALWAAMDRCPTLTSLLTRFSHNLATQVSYTALSDAVHQVDERLARWLLMVNDRLRQKEFPITHEYMSVMLAVRRPSVTTALHVLEGNRFIRAERGCIIIRDRKAMEEFCRDAYGVPEAEYASLFGSAIGP